MRSRPFAAVTTPVSEIGLRVPAFENETDVVRLAQVALDDGVNYFQVSDERAFRLVQRALGERRSEAIIGAVVSLRSFAANFNAALRGMDRNNIEVLWLRADSGDRAPLTAALAQMRSWRDDGRVMAFGLDLTPLPAADQVEVGRWAIEEAEVPLLAIYYSLHEPEVGRALFAGSSDAATRFVVVLPQEMTALDTWLGPDLAEVVSAFARKTRHLRFLTHGGRSLAQAALKFALAQPSVACVLPAIASLEDLHACLTVADAPDLTQAELNRIDDLVTHGFHLQAFEPPSVYNG